jgi:uncharacterized membrane protein YfcA
MILAAFVLVLAAGIAIGITGVGGVLIVPVLAGAGRFEVGAAVAAASTAFLFPGLQAWWQTASPRRGQAATGSPVVASGAAADGMAAAASPALAIAMPAAAFAGALAGAFASHVVEGAVMRVAIAAVALMSGIHAWGDAAPRRWRHGRPEAAIAGTGLAATTVIGLLVGIGSGLTGTGGPVLLLPLLMALRAPMPAAVQTARRIQLPIALAATGIHVIEGRFDPALVLGIGVLLLIGGAIGHRIAARLSVPRLKQTMGVLLCLTGLWFGLQVFRGNAQG